ncbi:F0F1 ATP synthase subunit A [Nostoc sp. 'Peltigera malacea cyanobiont' DB3992]|uniref:F0F1 ATP synthase subunit A n=1 Tax=Nostoc sp. 'Peltigera malacea cyanobiont' DB3992 TaxID=1206980 RepID=UPI00211E69AB|nr:F0F1 ATP synthase subunit A [Nostoc sp. 'Peltigera malacea cyanobiont' DB3992]
MCILCAPFLVSVSKEYWKYLHHYLEPNPILFPFYIISELSRTLALAVRLFGNVMSDGMIVAILISIAHSFFQPLCKL